MQKKNSPGCNSNSCCTPTCKDNPDAVEIHTDDFSGDLSAYVTQQADIVNGRLEITSSGNPPVGDGWCQFRNLGCPDGPGNLSISAETNRWEGTHYTFGFSTDLIPWAEFRIHVRDGGDGAIKLMAYLRHENDTVPPLHPEPDPGQYFLFFGQPGTSSDTNIPNVVPADGDLVKILIDATGEKNEYTATFLVNSVQVWTHTVTISNPLTNSDTCKVRVLFVGSAYVPIMAGQYDNFVASIDCTP